MDDSLNSYFATCVQSPGAANPTCQFDGNPNGILVANVGADTPSFVAAPPALVTRQITSTATSSANSQFFCTVIKPQIPDSYCVSVTC